MACADMLYGLRRAQCCPRMARVPVTADLLYIVVVPLVIRCGIHSGTSRSIATCEIGCFRWHVGRHASGAVDAPGREERRRQHDEHLGLARQRLELGDHVRAIVLEQVALSCAPALLLSGLALPSLLTGTPSHLARQLGLCPNVVSSGARTLPRQSHGARQ